MDVLCITNIIMWRVSSKYVQIMFPQQIVVGLKTVS